MAHWNDTLGRRTVRRDALLLARRVNRAQRDPNWLLLDVNLREDLKLVATRILRALQ